MKFLRKNIIYLVGAILILLIFGGAYYFINASNQEPQEKPVETKQVIKTLKPEDIGLTLDLRSDSQAINMTISIIDGISSVEYEASYEAEVVDSGETMKVLRGVGPSTLEVKAGDVQLRREILLGTCSRNVCKYDKGVTEVDFIIKVNYVNGEVGSVEEKVTL